MSGKILVGSGRAAEGCRRSFGGANSWIRLSEYNHVHVELNDLNEQQQVMYD